MLEMLVLDIGTFLNDLSKAFDCIDHELLLAKLNDNGLDSTSLFFLSSFYHLITSTIEHKEWK